MRWGVGGASCPDGRSVIIRCPTLESGYPTANPREWIEKLSPEVVLLSVATGDREGRPSPETLKAVEGYALLRTDRNGWIELTTGGEQIWVEVDRR